MTDTLAAASVPRARATRRAGPWPWLLADWVDAAFLHWAVDPAALAPYVPFPLDRWRGEAYASVVCFTQRRLRPRFGGTLAALLTAPIAEHAFCNLRAYVRVAGVPGICFLREWIPNRLALRLGPATYGLPYRFGRLRQGADPGRGGVRHEVAAAEGRLAFALDAGSAVARPVDPLSRDAFLLERYAAFVRGPRDDRGFRIAHAPWPARVADVEIDDLGLLAAHAPWLAGARLVGGHLSPGVVDVRIGRPAVVGDPDRRWLPAMAPA
jgi:uncharacterized protein